MEYSSASLNDSSLSQKESVSNTNEISLKMKVEGKSLLIAYLLWWFLGLAGVHRFYLNRTKTALAQLALSVLGGITVFVCIVSFFLIGFIFIGFIFLIPVGIWWILDVYFTYKIVQEENNKIGINHSSLVSTIQSSDRSNNAEQLEKIHSLFEKGVLTKEQYESKKAELVQDL